MFYHTHYYLFLGLFTLSYLYIVEYHLCATTHCYPILCSVTSHRRPEVSPGESIRTAETGKHYHAGLPSPHPERLMNLTSPALEKSHVSSAGSALLHLPHLILQGSTWFLAQAAWGLLGLTALNGSCLDYWRKRLSPILGDRRAVRGGCWMFGEHGL